MSDLMHIKLAETLKNVTGKVALSGYRCDLFDELYKDWNMHVARTKKALSIKSDRTEILWTNY